MKLNNCLREKRLDVGLSQEELSEKSGVSRATISSIENNNCVDVKSSTLIALADALNCRVSDIFFT